jgi:hypothetical protein
VERLPRLTLAYGLRWEINFPLRGSTRRTIPFIVTGPNNPATMALALRIGIAYQLGRMANRGALLRGGFGIFYNQGYGSQFFIGA